MFKGRSHSNRGCPLGLLLVALAGLASFTALAAAAPAQAPATPTAPAAPPAAVTIDGRSVTINGTRELILSGSIHYARVHPDDWERVFLLARELHMNTIETYFMVRALRTHYCIPIPRPSVLLPQSFNSPSHGVSSPHMSEEHDYRAASSAWSPEVPWSQSRLPDQSLVAGGCLHSS